MTFNIEDSYKYFAKMHPEHSLHGDEKLFNKVQKQLVKRDLKRANNAHKNK